MSSKSSEEATTLAAVPEQGQRSVALLLLCLFFLSGFSALAYQTAWQRMLGAFAGSDSVATTMIVGAFLFGLGIGSLIGAFWRIAFHCGVLCAPSPCARSAWGSSHASAKQCFTTFSSANLPA